MPSRFVAMQNKYTKDAHKTIVDAIKLGETFKGAAMAVGIAESTLWEWRHKYPKLSNDITKATSDMRRANIAYIAKKAPTQWQAAAWLLERRFPDEFGRRNVEVSGPGGGSIAIEERTKIQEAGEVARKLRDDSEAFAKYEDFLLEFSKREQHRGNERR